jgi:YqaJ-like viral recombinase domain
MEQDMLVEAFNASEKLYGLRYTSYIGDGDSSVYARIQEKCAYGKQVTKVLCRNHALRSFKSGLYGIATNCALKHPQLRKLLRGNIDRIIKNINIFLKKRGDLLQNKLLDEKEITSMLKSWLKNVPFHVFGDHANCDDGCQRKCVEGEINHVPLFKQTEIWREIENRVYYLVMHADNLGPENTTNSAENFMGVNNKVQGAKRVNRSNRGSYYTRVIVAALKKNDGYGYIGPLTKRAFGASPNKRMKRLIAVRQERKSKQKVARDRRISENPEAALRGKPNNVSLPDFDYGDTPVSVADIDQEEFDKRKNLILTTLEKEVDTAEKRAQLCEDTIGQYQNAKYISAKDKRLSSSKFPKIYLMKDHTHPHCTVKEMRGPRRSISHRSSIAYGLVNEDRAIEEYCTLTGATVIRNGLFVNEKWCYLAASPDGLIGIDTVVEVKSLYSARERVIFEYVAEMQGLDAEGNPILLDGKVKKPSTIFSSVCLHIVDKVMKLKKDHAYYYQIQGQLAITERKYCIFIAKTNVDLFHERIEFDEKIWNAMLIKLNRFYFDCLLPEIIDPRIKRQQKVRDPEYYLRAMAQIEASKIKRSKSGNEKP